MKEKVYSVMCEIFGISPDKISNTTSTENLVEWDSLGHMNLVMALEDELNIKFNEDDIGKMTNVKDLLEIVQKAHNTKTKNHNPKNL